jgi:hypothetical protein
LTWIINLVKWNAGHTKYKFDENALGGHKIMNNALVATKGGSESQEELGDNVNTDEDKANTYGLMIGNPKHQDSNYLNSQGN